MKADKPVSVRRGLTEITNSCLPPPQKFPLTPTSKSHVEKLLQENAALIKLIEERDKMVEASGTAVQKLRVNFHKLQAQNATFAKSITQNLTELNAVKDKLRVLQHELACKNVVLKARVMEQEVLDEEKNAKALAEFAREMLLLNPVYPLRDHSPPEEEAVATKPSCDHTIANKPSTQSRRQNQQRQSLGAPSTCGKEDEKFKVQNRRQSLRRQSGRFQTRVLEPEENLFEIEEAKYPINQPYNMPKPDQKLETTCSSPSKEGEESNSCSAKGKEAAKRSLMGRPLRRAAKKVQSYKEMPLNIKMRRME